MRHAPAVQLRCSEPAPGRVVEAFLRALAAAVLAAWLSGWLDASAAAGLAVALAAAAAAAWWTLRRGPPPPRRLIWDGQAWWLASAAADAAVGLQTVDVMLDAGSWMLLRALSAPAAGSAPKWHWLGLRDEPGPDFRGLCTALYAQRSTIDPAAALPDRFQDAQLPR